MPGYAISNYVASASAGTVSSNFPTTSSNIVFYWVDGASGRTVKCSAILNGKTTTAHADFNILRPEAHVTAFSGTVSLDHNFYLTAENTNVFGLHYGYGNGGPDGIKFFRIVSVPSGFTGTNLWVQLINSMSRGHLNTNGLWYARQATNVLDTFYPYNITIPNATTTSDNPGEGIYPIDTGISVNDSFSMWLMFQPTGGIPVPLRVVNWSWSGSGSLSGTNWAETNWVLNSHSNTIDPADTDAKIFPQWTNNIINITNYVAQP